MIYLDTSSLLKLLLPEPESAAARIAVMSEAKAIISPLAELETLIQLRGMWLGGELRTSEHNQLRMNHSLSRKFLAQQLPRLSGNIRPLEDFIAALLTVCIWRRWRNWGCAG